MKCDVLGNEDRQDIVESNLGLRREEGAEIYDMKGQYLQTSSAECIVPPMDGDEDDETLEACPLRRCGMEFRTACGNPISAVGVSAHGTFLVLTTNAR